RLGDRRDVVDAGVALELQIGHVLAVADRSDHRHEFALGHVSLRSDALDTGYDGLHLLPTGPLFHHDHHLNLDLSKPLVGTLLAVRPWPCGRAGCKGVRRTEVSSVGGCAALRAEAGRGRTPS